jgi:hypothetical protein
MIVIANNYLYQAFLPRIFATPRWMSLDIISNPDTIPRVLKHFVFHNKARPPYMIFSAISKQPATISAQLLHKTGKNFHDSEESQSTPCVLCPKEK